jgi:hypothetical protein
MEGSMGSATIQANFAEGKCPIGRFILERARALGMSRSDLVQRLGYSDFGSGHKALNAILLTGSVAPQMARHLADALETDDALVGFIIGATMRQRRDGHPVSGRLI